jgi:hypothetical protein
VLKGNILSMVRHRTCVERVFKCRWFPWEESVKTRMTNVTIHAEVEEKAHLQARGMDVRSGELHAEGAHLCRHTISALPNLIANE